MRSSRNSWRALRNAAAIEKAAGDWLARRDRGFSPAEAEAFAAWESADPRHAAEIARLNSTWAALDTADEVPEIMDLSRQMDEVLERADRRGRRQWRLFGALAAAAAVAIGLLRPEGIRPVVRAPETSPVASTCRVIPSSARPLTLSDGSLVTLNADALVEPAFSPGERRVRLVRGEAHFDVAKDPARPFVVEVGSVTLCAVGTAFNVRLDRAAVQLLVTEGKVRVEPRAAESERAPDSPLVIAGQRLVMESDESAAALAALRPEPVSPEELERSLAWKDTQIVFDRTPLVEAVAAFNRFNSHQLVVDDPALAARKLGGAFQAGNIEAFVHLLETGFDVSADRGNDRMTILRGRK